MAVAFTEFEILTINEKLKTRAREYMQTKGIKATTVEVLADEAGISKGAFYRFYDSKELLFFEVLKEGVDGVFKELGRLEKDMKSMSSARKVELMILMAVIHADGLLTTKMLQTELEILLKKLPKTELNLFLGSLAERTSEFLGRQKVTLKGSVHELLLMTYIHILSLANRDKIGLNFDEVIQVMIRGNAKILV